MSNRSLAEALNDSVDTEKLSLPVYPVVARRIQSQRETLDAPEDLQALVEMDPALVSTLFRAANASYFKGLTPTETIDEAITRLGLERSLQVINRACLEGESCPGGKLVPRYLYPLWQHSVGCALGAQWLAKQCGYQGLAQQAYLAGLLHDIGKLFLITSLEKIATCDNFGLPLSDRLVHEILQTMHLERGRLLITSWQLPEIFLKVVEAHHAPGLDQQNIVLALVKLANLGCHKVGLGLDQDRTLVLPTTAEAQFLGISEIALAEYEIMLEDRFFGSAPEEMYTKQASG